MKTQTPSQSFVDTIAKSGKKKQYQKWIEKKEWNKDRLNEKKGRKKRKKEKKRESFFLKKKH